jgi:tetrahydromethanopterin S-methyltransferase subunit G
MKIDFHVDMSGKMHNEKTIGIALVSSDKKIQYGCALKGNLIRLIKDKLFYKNDFEDYAKLYAICISLLIKQVRKEVKTLIICNDEDFEVVKKTLNYLLKPVDFEIINISEFRKRFGRNIGSLADNHARIYRKKALTFNIIKQYWEKLNENKM